MKRVWPWLILLGSLVLGTVLMGLPRGHGLAEALALVGLGVMVGGWLLAARHIGGISTAGSVHNDRMLRDIEARLEHFETPELLTQAAAIYLEREKLKKAQHLLERAFELSNDHAGNRTRYLLGQVYLRRGEATAAWRMFDAVYRNDGNYQFGEIKLWAARTYLALNEPEVAYGLVEEFLKRERGHFIALSIKADALFALQRSDEAKQVYHELLDGLQHAPGATREKLRDLERHARRRLEQ